MHLLTGAMKLSTKLYTRLSPGWLVAVINLSTRPTTDATS